MMLEGHNIICFGSARWSYSGFQQHTMRLLSKRNKVLFVNPIGTRRISLKRDLLAAVLHRLRKDGNPRSVAAGEVFVADPRIIPLVYNRLAQAVSRTLLRRQMRRLLQELGFESYILWVGSPTAAFILDLFQPEVTVYNPVDRYRAFSFVDAAKIRAYERVCASRSDLVICTSEAIRRDLQPYNEHTVTVPHGVSFEHFHSALASADIPDDIASIPLPIIGFYGGLSEWIDLPLLLKVALRYPKASVVLIGLNDTRLGGLLSLPNVHFLGFKPFARLPHYLKRFTVCLIPFLLNELVEAVDPTKLREYMSIGKPVVCTDLPEAKKYAGLVHVTDGHARFLEAVGEALAEDDPVLREERIAAARRCDWHIRIEEISGLVSAHLDRKRAAIGEKAAL